MKIAYIYPSINRKGGVERYLSELITITKDRHEVELFTHEVDSEFLSIAQQKIPCLKRPRFLTQFSFCLFAQRALLKKTERISHTQGASAFRQDIVHAHSVHKAWFLISLQQLPRFSKHWFLKILNPIHHLTIFTETIQYLPGNFKKVIAISHCVKDELKKYYKIPEHKIAVVYSGVNLDYFHPNKRASGRKEIQRSIGRDLQDDELTLIFVANEFKRKGLRIVLDALAKPSLQKVNLLIVGRDSVTLYHDQIAQLGLRGRVFYLGSRRDLDLLYSGSDALVFPTQYEPFGLVITEAMASGIPVITSRLAGAAELIIPDESGILLKDCFDSQELASQIERLRDGALRISLGAAARAKVMAYHWHHAADEIDKVYEEIARQQPTS